MNFKTTSRITNGIFWLWMWLSAAMMPVTNGSDDFWAGKTVQLFSLNPNIHDTPRLAGNILIPLILWFIFDRIIKPKSKTKTQVASE